MIFCTNPYIRQDFYTTLSLPSVMVVIVHILPVLSRRVNIFYSGFALKIGFVQIEQINGWESPLLRIRFQLTAQTLEIYRQDGQKFLTPLELDQLREQERQAKETALQQLEQEQKHIKIC